jgi:hypothetical protein
MSHHDSDLPMLPPHSPIAAGAILLGIFVALSLAVGGLVHLAELVAAVEGIDAAHQVGSFDPPSAATSRNPNEAT